MAKGKRHRRNRTRLLGFERVNYAALGLGAAMIVAGYALLDRGSVTVAPILLVLGYVGLLPAALVLGWRRLG